MRFFADAEAAERGVVKLEQKLAALEAKIAHLNKRGRQSADGIPAALDAWQGKLAGIAAGYLALPALIGRVIEGNKEFIAQADQAGVKYDELFRRFRVQASLSELEGEQARARIQELAIKNSVPIETAVTTAQQLSSSGFDAEAASGKALDVMLKTLASGNLIGTDPSQLTRAASQFLSSQDLEKDAETLERMMIAVQRLKIADTELMDLTQIAGKASGMAGKLTPFELLASFNVIRSTTGADKASTGQKIFVERLTQSLGSKERERELATLGLKPQDVDFIGEDLMTVLNRLGERFDALDEDTRDGVLGRLWGTEASSAVSALLRGREKIPEYIEMMNDREGFLTDAQVNQTGKAAARRRFDLRKEISQAQAGTDETTLLLDILQQRAMQRGPKWYAHLERGFADTARFLGAGEETAASFFLPFGSGGRQELESARAEAQALASGDTKALLEATKEQTAVLRDLRDKARPAVNRNAGVE